MRKLEPKPADDPDVRKSVTMPERMWDEIDAYGDSVRIRTLAEAHRREVPEGLDALKAKAAATG